MSLGDTYNNNQQQSNQKYSVTVTSAYKFSNIESNIDVTSMRFRFWRNNLCIDILPKKNTGNDELAWDYDNGITIYLSHTKARILKNELENFLRDPIGYNGSGVPSGQAIITISNGAEYGKNAPVITIRKIDENGNVVASFAYEFKQNYHYSIRGYEGTKNFTKVFDDYQNLEIEQMVTILDEYVKATTNAVAYTVMDQRQYTFNRAEGKLDQIASALGVDTSSKPASNRRSYNNSYFNSANGNQKASYASGGSYTPATLDDIE